MAKKVLTNAYSQLRGFSTDSKYVRPANVADIAVNINRLPDGTFAPRRGYQVKVDEVGGYGCAVYEDIPNDESYPVTISKDGNLYKILEGFISIGFVGSSAKEYLTYEIYVDQENTSDTTECDFNPYDVVLDDALVTDCINFRLKKVTAYTGEAIGAASSTYSGTLANFPIQPGSLVMTDGTYTIYDDADGSFTGNIGVGTNTINYTTGAYVVKFSAVTGAVTASYTTPLTEVLDICMGKGYNEATPYLITDLEAALNTITGVSVVTIGNTDQPAAFLPLIRETNIPSGKTGAMFFNYPVEANRTVSSTLSGMVAFQNDADFQIPTLAPYREILFIGSEYDEVQKFDGQTVYRAGMPQGAEPTPVDAAAGNVDTGTHLYYVTYEQIDNQGNIVEGVLSTGYTIVLGSARQVDVTVNNLEQESGWNTNCAISTSNQTGVFIIAVDDGSGGSHSIRAGDTIYFLENPAAIVNGLQAGVRTITVDAGHTVYEGNVIRFTDDNNGETRIRTVVSTAATTITFDPDEPTVDVADNAEISVYRTREVASRTASTITLLAPENILESNTVSIKNNAVISNQLKIKIWRTQAGDVIPELLVELPNDSYSATQTYTDEVTDTDLNLQVDYSTPTRLHNPPPKTAIAYAYNNLMIYTKDPVNDDYVWFSEPDEPEYVPEATNNFIIPSNDDDVSGVGTAGSSLIVFKNRSIYSVSGELATSQFDVNPIGTGSNIGCVSHHSIQSVGGLLYFVHTNGVYSISENQFFPTDNFGNPVAISSVIDTRFREESLDNDKKLVFKRSTAINYTKDNQYILFIPTEESDTSLPKASNENERIFVFDYQKKDWFEWVRINAAGNWYIQDDNLHWFSRGYKNSTTISRLYRQHRTYTLIDQVDHVTPIRVTWQSSWEDVGQPRVRKKFARCALLFDDLRSQFLENTPTLCFSSFTDWIEDRPKTQANLMQKIESTLWSDSQWSYLDWDGYQDTFIVVNMMNSSVAKAVKIQLQLNKLNSTFKLQGFQFEASIDFRSTFVR